MIIQIPKDVQYKGNLIKAYTKFNCDSLDFKKFIPLGAWAIVHDEPKKKGVPNGKSKKA